MKKTSYARESIAVIIAAGITYWFSCTAQSALCIRSQRIEDQSQLESKLLEERKKLREKIKDDVIIHASLDGDEHTSLPHSEKIKDREYKIVLTQQCSDQDTLRHELYHIADGHFEDMDRIKYIKNIYYLWFEAQAVIYELTGLKP